MQEILFADDDRVMRKSFCGVFAAEGFSVRAVKNGEECVAAFLEKRPDVVVLDVMMPGMNGFETCQAIRRHDADVPVLFLSCLPDDTKKLRAYNLGADDYVEKGTNSDVIVAKLRALLRRVSASAPAPAEADCLRLGAVEVNLKSQDVFCDGACIERLTKTEADILKILASPRGQTFTCDELIARLRGEGFACTDMMLYSHVSRLRRKLGTASTLLSSNRDSGYCLLK